MGLSDYNGFPGKMRKASLRRVHKLWDSGEVPRPVECMACGQTEGALHGHSEDYSNDHIHIPICITCHLILHMRWQQPLLWESYKDAIREGWRGIALEQRNALYEIKRLYPPSNPDIWPMDLVNEKRSGTVLDMICPIKFIHPNAPQPDTAASSCHTDGTNPFAMPERRYRR